MKKYGKEKMKDEKRKKTEKYYYESFRDWKPKREMRTKT